MLKRPRIAFFCLPLVSGWGGGVKSFLWQMRSFFMGSVPGLEVDLQASTEFSFLAALS